MRRSIATAISTATVAAGLAVLVPASPAGAAVSASTTGTKLVISLTGKAYIGFACSGGKVAVVDGTGDADVTTVASPALACSALTQVEVTGDAGNQAVYGEDLDAAPFSAKPRLVVTLGDGADGGSETLQSDSLDYGPGEDFVSASPGGVANAKFDLGAGSGDAVSVEGNPGADQFTLTSTGTTLTIARKTGATTATAAATNAKRAFARGGAGNDTFTATGITAASSVKSVTFDGNDGDDTLTTGVTASQLDGGLGTNTFNLGTGADDVYTASDTDTVNASPDGARDLVYDGSSLRFGGRVLTGFANSVAASDVHTTYSTGRDVTIRVRPTAGGTLETMSLNRTGQQLIPSAIEFLQNGITDSAGKPPRRALVDVVMGPQGSLWTGNGNATELFDITAPTGTFTSNENSNQVQIQSGGYSVTVPKGSTRLVHAPWADKPTSFAHRSTRDLLFRFLGSEQREDTADALTSGATTRAKIVDGIVNSDEYRGLDVDRVFTQFLRRKADAGGRSYWVSSLRNGKALWRFRAQLLGSNEYFTKAGATNEAFLVKAYNDVLGRNPDPSGKAYWTNKLNAGADRGAVALQFLSSTEARRNIVKDQYLRFLDRVPTTPEADAWIAKLGSTTTGEQDLVRSLASSAAYYDRT